MYPNLGLLDGRKSCITYIVRLEFHCTIISSQVCAKLMSFGAMKLSHRITSVVISIGTVTVK